MSEIKNPIILFDGVCNLCNSMVRFTIRRDPGGKFKFTTLQSRVAKDLLKKHHLHDHDFDSFILIIGDRYYKKSTAGLKVLKELGGVWRWVYILIYVPRPIRDFFYHIIAKSRYKLFGKRETCMIPTDEIKERFLS